MSKLRLVLDTNVLISSVLIDSSVPQRVFDYALAEAIVLLSESTQAELGRILTKEKFNRYLSLEKRLQFMAALTLRAELVTINESIEICRDRKDNQFLELAACGQAAYLITGDRDLLILNPFRQTVVITPVQFLEQVISK
ncbi:putative toxin-antitoxin system toxin component, PIN family [Romeria aff. gracilis LEGE 07310]|uniref:Putative toxin-antitoxin system toxin component, PIN family n=1 Tax=Vasconcelosia minhoensis LEGE 07310 TaxID=915328 RepID=A0A8J7AUQ5_9CYAN|nr:putative toxin-antitoxin system toxin component, PIN family [Romeria gracilis]MBE9077163.1 putative toxin-antitoxin system toxin component, PIN family [Romeria aff. gracilis LEGE 07310]